MKVKAAIRPFLFLVISFANLQPISAQEITKEYKTEVISTLSEMMNELYVLPDIAKKTQVHLEEQLKSGHFDQFKDDEAFAKALTESVQSINNDKHMKIWKNPPFEAPEQTPQRMIEEKIHNMVRFRDYNGGFHAVNVMEGNVGYIDLRGFTRVDQGKEFADAYMKLIAMTDAVIIDLSKNGGGDPAMVQYLCSYFFDEPVHLNSLYFRPSDETMDFYSLEEVGGEKMIDIPLFVITSERTFSGAEEFSYNMQTQKRATLVGQTTGGGANPGGTRGINENLSVFIPTGMAINPITKTNWEGVGVIPEVKTTSEESLTKTHELAMEAAKKYREDSNTKLTTGFMDLLKVIENYDGSGSASSVFEKIKLGTETGIINEDEINGLGYTYLMQYEKPKVALAIFKSNTILFPTSPNTYDSYAECYMMMGDLKSSKLNYQKAIEVAEKNEDGRVGFYKENLAKVEQMIKEGK